MASTSPRTPTRRPLGLTTRDQSYRSKLSRPVTGVLYVAIGGLAGVLSRYGLTLWAQSIWTVAAINLAGSFLLGLLVYVGAGWDRDVRDGIGVGFLGGFTTLSTLAVQTVLESEGGRPGTAAAYLAVNVVGGLAMAAAGYMIGRAVA